MIDRLNHYAVKNILHAGACGLNLRSLYALRTIIASEWVPHAMTSPLTLVSLPLFPLHTVLFPGGYLPLKVFEQRYRTMVRCCREQGSPFGVVTLRSGSEVNHDNHPLERFHSVGTIARIDGVTSLSSGLEMIQCLGKDRFRINATRKLPAGLWVGDVTLLHPDRTILIPPDLRHSVTALQQVLHKMPLHHQDFVHEEQFSDCGWVANRWCELFPLEEALQLQLLEMDSPLLRLELVTDALERAGIIPRHHIKT